MRPPIESTAPITATRLRDALATPLPDDDATRLAEQLRAQIPKADLTSGRPPLIDELTVAWILHAPGASPPPVVVSEAGTTFRLPLARLGQTDIYAAAATLPAGSAMRWRYLGSGVPIEREQLEVYLTHPDSRPRPGVPRGIVEQQSRWRSGIFPGTVRDWWLYVPVQYDVTRGAAVMLFQDGAGYKEYVPPVFDNLIDGGEMPPTIGVFIDPGTLTDTTVSNRSFEYDTLSDQYSRFVLEEILPAVEQRYRLRDDAESRAIGGISSGGICAFTVAWQRPDRFSKVLSWVGSFTNIASGPTLRDGGHNYPSLIRKVPRKAIRVFLQGGEQDLDNAHGNWPLANQEMASALAFADYDHQFVYGHGFHSTRHGLSILPDSLRWLWRDHKG